MCRLLREYRFTPSDDDSANFVAQRRGNPALLSQTWNVSVDALRNYLVNWEMTDIDENTFKSRRSGKAYAADRFEYGDFNQVFDFLRALGGLDPLNLSAGARWHALSHPDRE